MVLIGKYRTPDVDAIDLHFYLLYVKPASVNVFALEENNERSRLWTSYYTELLIMMNICLISVWKRIFP